MSDSASGDETQARFRQGLLGGYPPTRAPSTSTNCEVALVSANIGAPIIN